MKSKVKYSNLEEFVNHTRAQGRHAFSREELKSEFNLSEKALNQALFRYTSKGKIANIRHGFYAIISPEYSHYGMIPIELFIDDLMKSLDKSYYISLFSAAAFHGASHQKIMKSYVITEKPALRNIDNEKLGINFFVKQSWNDDDIVKKKTDAGYINISSPELTALDLLTYDFSLNRVFTVLEELIDKIKPKELIRTAQNFSQTTSIQRLGYLVDKELQNEKLALALKKAIGNRKVLTIPLLKGEKTDGEVDSDWKVVKNIQVESDL
ncbi:MAG: type IV toxin-antitoxin system AbiEi family antitoxin [Cyclobacteriaceae bacterium]